MNTHFVRREVTFPTIFLLFSVALSGGDETEYRIKEQLLELAHSSGVEERITIIGELETIGGDAVNEIYDAYRVGNLYFWEGMVVTSDGIVEDSNYVKHIRPVDIFTKEYIRSKDFIVPVKSLTALSANREERKALSQSQAKIRLSLFRKRSCFLMRYWI